MPPTPEQAELGYHRMWDRCTVEAGKVESAKKIASKIVAGREAYERRRHGRHRSHRPEKGGDPRKVVGLRFDGVTVPLLVWLAAHPLVATLSGAAIIIPLALFIIDDLTRGD
jgi:hypothetical protein